MYQGILEIEIWSINDNVTDSHSYQPTPLATDLNHRPDLNQAV